VHPPSPRNSSSPKSRAPSLVLMAGLFKASRSLKSTAPEAEPLAILAVVLSYLRRAHRSRLLPQSQVTAVTSSVDSTIFHCPRGP